MSEANDVDCLVMKPYFHEKATQDELDQMREDGKTWGDVMEKYAQPDWCEYPEALGGAMGCWSLVSFKIKSKKSCETCELCKAS